MNLEELKNQKFETIICYGLGSLITEREYFFTKTPQQFEFLLYLKNYLNIKEVYIYDPVFTEFDIQFIKKFDINVLSDNIYKVFKKTIFYCPYLIYDITNLILHHNLDNLSNICIIGNDTKWLFEKYQLENIYLRSISNKFSKVKTLVSDDTNKYLEITLFS